MKWFRAPLDEAAQRLRREKMVARDIAQPTERGRPPVGNPAVLQTIATVPRHRFVPQRLSRRAYEDGPLPIGHGQTISQPYMVAIMTELLNPEPSHSILEIGTGSGYQTAVLANLVKYVYSVEIITEFEDLVRDRLDGLGYRNVSLRVGDGAEGWPEHGPYDGIMVTAAVERIPQPLIDQLKPFGRMIVPIGPRAQVQSLMIVSKRADGVVDQHCAMHACFVSLVGNAP